jgi:hypothetical protein
LSKVYSYCQSNISVELRRSQRRVFEHFGLELEQQVDDQRTHGEWMRWLLEKHRDEDVVVIADIDAFPLKASAVLDLVFSANKGEVAGLAQVANHKDPSRIYAGPMFIALQAGLYRQLGSPNLKRWSQGDVGQKITDLAHAQNVPVRLIEPKFALVPKWDFAGRGVFGVGTFYGDLEFFHLFESRNPGNEAVFVAVAEGTIAGQHDFAEYLRLAEGQTPPVIVKKQRFIWPFKSSGSD